MSAVASFLSGTWASLSTGVSAPDLYAGALKPELPLARQVFQVCPVEALLFPDHGGAEVSVF